MASSRNTGKRGRKGALTPMLMLVIYILLGMVGILITLAVVDAIFGFRLGIVNWIGGLFK